MSELRDWAQEEVKVMRQRMEDPVRQLRRLSKELEQALGNEEPLARQAARLDYLQELITGIGVAAGYVAKLENDVLESK